MENFDNIFTTAPAEETQQPQTASRDDFDVDAWAQKKQAERDGLFIQLDERDRKSTRLNSSHAT